MRCLRVTDGQTVWTHEIADQIRCSPTVGTSPDGIEFDSIDGEPVHAVFMLLARINDPGPHIRALAEIARLVQTPGLYRRLVEAGSAKEILNVLDAEE